MVGFRHLNQITGESGGGRLFALAPISHETVFLLREDWDQSQSVIPHFGS